LSGSCHELCKARSGTGNLSIQASLARNSGSSVRSTKDVQDTSASVASTKSLPLDESNQTDRSCESCEKVTKNSQALTNSISFSKSPSPCLPDVSDLENSIAAGSCDNEWEAGQVVKLAVDYPRTSTQTPRPSEVASSSWRSSSAASLKPPALPPRVWPVEEHVKIEGKAVTGMAARSANCSGEHGDPFQKRGSGIKQGAGVSCRSVSPPNSTTPRVLPSEVVYWHRYESVLCETMDFILPNSLFE
jgi:hypothetical protein